MTGTQQNLTQKKPDLKFYYKLAEETAQACNIDQALKISQDGLKFTQSQNKAEGVERFDNLNSQLSQPSPDHSALTPSIVKEDFTIIKGF